VPAGNALNVNSPLLLESCVRVAAPESVTCAPDSSAPLESRIVPYSAPVGRRVPVPPAGSAAPLAPAAAAAFVPAGTGAEINAGLADDAADDFSARAPGAARQANTAMETIKSPRQPEEIIPKSFDFTLERKRPIQRKSRNKDPRPAIATAQSEKNMLSPEMPSNGELVQGNGGGKLRPPKIPRGLLSAAPVNKHLSTL